jgi:predicted nucleic acid-binding protein
MTGRAFVDSNILVYSRDSSEPEKQRKAQEWMAELWRSRQGRLSFQVLQEFYVTVTRKLNPGMSASDARADVRALLAWEPVVVGGDFLETGWRIQDRFQVSWWDSLIIAAAQTIGARYLLSEDLATGTDFDGVTVVNPLLASFSELD